MTDNPNRLIAWKRLRASVMAMRTAPQRAVRTRKEALRPRDVPVSGVPEPSATVKRTTNVNAGSSTNTGDISPAEPNGHLSYHPVLKGGQAASCTVAGFTLG